MVVFFVLRLSEDRKSHLQTVPPQGFGFHVFNPVDIFCFYLWSSSILSIQRFHSIHLKLRTAVLQFVHHMPHVCTFLFLDSVTKWTEIKNLIPDTNTTLGTATSPTLSPDWSASGTTYPKTSDSCLQYSWASECAATCANICVCLWAKKKQYNDDRISRRNVIDRTVQSTHGQPAALHDLGLSSVHISLACMISKLDSHGHMAWHVIMSWSECGYLTALCGLAPSVWWWWTFWSCYDWFLFIIYIDSSVSSFLNQVFQI